MKKEIIQILIDQQTTIVNDIQSSIDIRKKAADLDENETRDMEDFSHQNQNTEVALALAGQLSNAQSELEVLKRFQNYENDDFSEGALVETEMAYFLVGPSVGRGTYEGKEIICVSDQSPVFQTNEGAKKGDTMKLAEKKQKILAIY